jgi:hypothetical protein
MMPDTVGLEPTLAHPDGTPVIDKYNNFSYGPSVAVPCYVARTNKRVLDVRGRELVSTVQVFLGLPELKVTVNDRITLPDGARPAIIQVLGSEDENGEPYHLEIRA